MCAINPKQQRHFTLSVYTSIVMSEEEFLDLVCRKTLAVELALNEDFRLRWHVADTPSP
jgi:hypothetical protein